MTARAIETADPEETAAAGRRLAETLAPGAVVALYGDLGAGKTQFVRGLVDGLGGDSERVTSPTFTFVQEYASAAAPVYHVDAYRAETLDELLLIGIEDVLFGVGIAVVEWPSLLEPLFPASTVRVRLEHLGGNRRRIEYHLPRES